MQSNRFNRKAIQALSVFSLIATASAVEVKRLNVSYDVAREFYQEYNPLFAAYDPAKGGFDEKRIYESSPDHRRFFEEEQEIR
jgi:sulfate/thiosulfate transport system substrate-binding protein